jgi:hypothetical protein
MVYGPAAEVLALAALALATDRYATLGRELLELGIAIIEGPDGGCSQGRLKALVLSICRRPPPSSRHRSWP